MTDTPVVLLNGARQTGKTTMAQAMAPEAGAYFTIDDSATLALAAGDPPVRVHPQSHRPRRPRRDPKGH